MIGNYTANLLVVSCPLLGKCLSSCKFFMQYLIKHTKIQLNIGCSYKSHPHPCHMEFLLCRARFNPLHMHLNEQLVKALILRRYLVTVLIRPTNLRKILLYILFSPLPHPLIISAPFSVACSGVQMVGSEKKNELVLTPGTGYVFKGDSDDSQRRFLARHSIATLLLHCFDWLQHCSYIATLCCAKTCRCKSSHVTSP